MLDLIVASVLLPVLLPVIATLWLIARQDGNAGFYAHRRISRNGRSFRCRKHRTTVPDADTRLARHLTADPDAADEWACTQKLTRDPPYHPAGPSAAPHQP